MIKYLTIISFIIQFLFASCASTKPTFTPTPTTTPTFEQQRSITAEYLRAYNKIDNDLDQIVSTISFTSSTSSQSIFSDLIQLNNYWTQNITAYQGAIQRLDNVKVPEFEEIRNHFQASKKFMQDNVNGMQKIQSAVNAGNQDALNKSFSDLGNAVKQASTVNRMTEKLLLKYNITDTEVNYKFRGK